MPMLCGRLTRSCGCVHRQGPAVLLNAKTDLDAPTFQDLALISREKGRHQNNLKAQNQQLKSQVCLQGASADARIPLVFLKKMALSQCGDGRFPSWSRRCRP